jgi:hypothetical protein
LLAIDESRADMNEVTFLDFAGCMKELIGGLHVEIDEVEPSDSRWPNSARRAMNDSVWLDIENRLFNPSPIEHVDLPDEYICAVCEESGVGSPHQQMELGGGMGGGEEFDDVVTESAGCSGD